VLLSKAGAVLQLTLTRVGATCTNVVLNDILIDNGGANWDAGGF